MWSHQREEVQRTGLLASWVSVVSNLRTSSPWTASLLWRVRNVVQRLLASRGRLHLHSLGVVYMSTKMSLIFVEFLGTLCLQFTHSNINLTYFTRQHYNWQHYKDWSEIFITQNSLSNFFNSLKIWDTSYHVHLPTTPVLLLRAFYLLPQSNTFWKQNYTPRFSTSPTHSSALS